MKCRMAYFSCVLLLFVFVRCGNNGTSEPNRDSTGQSSSLPPETNYVMENNVNIKIKQADTGSYDVRSLDSIRAVTTMPAIDTLAWSAADTIKK